MGSTGEKKDEGGGHAAECGQCGGGAAIKRIGGGRRNGRICLASYVSTKRGIGWPVAAMTEVTDDQKKAVILDSIRGVPDFPKKGILFWDVTTILLNPTAFQYTVDLFAKKYRDAKIDVVAGE
eukprot:365187-Chlamydomonas_euryale.AAC.12